MATLPRNAWLKSLSLLVLVSFVVFCFQYSPFSTERIVSWRPNALPFSYSSTPDGDCDPLDVSTFQRFLNETSQTGALADHVTYYRRRITTESTLATRPLLSFMNEPLLSPEISVVLKGAALADEEITSFPQPSCLPPLVLPITSSPVSGDTNLSPILFGIATLHKRLQDSIPHLQRYLTRPASPTDPTPTTNNAGLLVLLHNATDSELVSAALLLQEAGISGTVHHSNPNDTMGQRYFSLLPAMYEQSQLPTEPTRSWLAFLDDDTFFVRPHALIHDLHNAVPDPANTQALLGTRPEVLSYQTDHSLTGGDHIHTPNGGGGIFLTLPLASRLLENDREIHDACLIEDAKTYHGDHRLCWCIERHTEVRSGWLDGLHQLDMFGDPSGFYESGYDMLSVHHWKSWHWLNPTPLSLVGDVCGEDCVLQRWLFSSPSSSPQSSSPSSSSPKSKYRGADALSKEHAKQKQREDEAPIILTNGYSLAQYPLGIDFDPEIAEATFDEYLGIPVDELDFGIGKFREKVPKEKKLSWKMAHAETGFVDTVLGRRKEVRQWYVLRRGGVIEKIAELVWT